MRWPGEDEYCTDWDLIVAAVESEGPDGPIHRARRPDTWFWYVPGHHELVLQNELTANANWQRAGGKGQRPKPVKRPWDKKETERKITPAQASDTDEFLDWFEARFAQA